MGRYISTGALWSARRVGRVFFPLDEELALLPSSFSPFIHQCIVRSGTLVPCEQVPKQVAALLGVQVSREMVRRLTEQAGTAQMAIEAADLHQAPRQEARAVEAWPRIWQTGLDSVWWTP